MLYNIVLNSANLVSGNTSSAYYNYDWSILPQGEYKATFSFTSTSTNILDLNNVPLLHIDLGQTNSYTTNTLMNSVNSFCIGNLSAVILNSTGFFRNGSCDLNTIYLKNVPSNKLFQVSIKNNATGLPWVDMTGTLLRSYVLSITLESIDEK